MPLPPLPGEDLEHVLEHTRDLWSEVRGGRIFLTGGTGFFGPWLVETFSNANDRLGLGAELVVLTRDPDGTVQRLPHYADLEIVKKNPFATIDTSGVGQLVEMACSRGRKTRPSIKLGICGEHGGDPASIHFFEKVKLDYVSCSPFRVPVARLAAAQAALSMKAPD